MKDMLVQAPAVGMAPETSTDMNAVTLKIASKVVHIPLDDENQDAATACTDVSSHFSSAESTTERSCEDDSASSCTSEYVSSDSSFPPVPTTVQGIKSILKYYDAAKIPVQEKPRVWKQLPRPNLCMIRMRSAHPVISKEESAALTPEPAKRKRVTFADIHMRLYEQTLGDNPCVSYGPPISLDWEYEVLETVTIDQFEFDHAPKRSPRKMMLNYYARVNILKWRVGLSEEEIKKGEVEANREKRRRSLTRAMLPAQVVEDFLQSAARKTKRLTQRRPREATV